MNRELIEAANLQTFHAPHGLPPADYVNQEMASRGGGYEPTSLREAHARILAAENVNGLALVVLLRVLNKDDPAQQGFVTVAVDLTGTQIYRTGSEGEALPKSSKTGYREYGGVIEALQNDAGLVANAISRERDEAASRANFLTHLLQDIPATAQAAPYAVDEPEAVPVQRTASRAQGARRE